MRCNSVPLSGCAVSVLYFKPGVACAQADINCIASDQLLMQLAQLAADPIDPLNDNS